MMKNFKILFVILFLCAANINAQTLKKCLVNNSDFETDISGWNSWGNSSTRAKSADGEGFGGGFAFKFTNPTVATDPWGAQVEYRIAEAISVDTEVFLKFMIKGDAAGSASVQMQNPSNYAGCGPFGSFDITTEWKEISLKTTITGVNGLQLIFNFGHYAGTVLIDNVTLCHEVRNCDLVANSDFETGIGGWNSWGNSSSRAQSAAGEGYGGGYAFKFTNPTVATDPWGAQVEYRIAEGIPVGLKTYLKFMIKGDVEGSASVQMQNPTNYAGCGPFGSFDITTEWKKITLETTITGVNGLQLIFNFGHYAGTVLIDDVTLCHEVLVPLNCDLVTNSDFEANINGWNSWGGSSSRAQSAEGEGYSGKYAFKFTNPTVTADPWGAQVEYRIAKGIDVGTKTYLKFMIKGDAAGSASVQMQNPDGYKGCGAFGSFDITTEWKKVSLETTITGVNGLQLIFNFGHYAGIVLMDDVSLCYEVSEASHVITIGTQPKKTTEFIEGEITGSLSIVASVEPAKTLSYQWYSNKTNSNEGGTKINGATGATFEIPKNLAAGTYYYYCVVSADGAESVFSNVATVTVKRVIIFKTQPAIITLVTVGSISSILTVEASITDGSALQYQWYSNEANSNKDGTAISEATHADFPIPTNLATGMYYYYCVVSSTTGAESVTSMVARVNVSAVTGTQEIITISVDMYPNPVRDQLFIKRSMEIVDLIEIIDFSGRVILRKVNFSDSSINISELSSGVFMLRLTHEGNVVVKRFTKE